MPYMRYVDDGFFSGLTAGRIYEIVREEEYDGDEFVDVIGDNGNRINGIFRSRFEPVEGVNKVPVGPVGIWAHHK